MVHKTIWKRKKKDRSTGCWSLKVRIFSNESTFNYKIKRTVSEYSFSYAFSDFTDLNNIDFSTKQHNLQVINYGAWNNLKKKKKADDLSAER